jgi:hypothetical protein
LKKNKFRKITLLNFKTCYKVTIITSLGTEHEDRHIDKRDRTENRNKPTFIARQFDKHEDNSVRKK